MRKVMIVMFALLAISMMTMPAYAQGGTAAAPATNWVAIASGFGMAIAAGLALLARARSALLPAKAWHATRVPVLEFSLR